MKSSDRQIRNCLWLPVLYGLRMVMHPKYQEAEQKYQGYRDAAYHVAWEAWHKKVASRQSDLRLLPIDDHALQQAETIWPALRDPERPSAFDWRAVYQQVRTTPRRIDLAVWSGSVLCGLMVGKASRGKVMPGADSNVTIYYLQGAPKQMNQLSGYIAPIALYVAESYATVLQREKLYLKSPLPSVQPLYTAYGFSLAKRQAKGLYMSKDVQG